MSISNEPIYVDVRRAWNRSALLFVVGPGAAGKSTLGRALAPRLGRTLVDLDEVFLERTGDIGAFIRDEGYEAYALANSELATALAAEATTPTVLVTSSGFLASDNPPDVLAANRALLRTGYNLSLLPAPELEAAVAAMVARQLTRSFNAGAVREEAKARERFYTYRTVGDLLVCTVARPDAVVERLTQHFDG